MATRTRVGPVTFGEFLEIVQEDEKADLIDGVIYMASPENIEHNDLVTWLVMILGPYLEARDLGKLHVNRVAFRLTAKTAPEPDVAVILKERLGLRRHGYVAGPPDLAIEIVSPDSVARDYDLKRQKYEAAGVREYWIIDPGERKATFFVRRGSAFVESRVKNHIFRSRVLPGFALDVRWFWKQPLPPTAPIVRALLSRAAAVD